MSTKTYAGFLTTSTYGYRYSLSGGNGYAICPLEDDDDHRYRSRVGYPWSNSGPWFTAERVIDVNNPSTDGAFDVDITRGTGTRFMIGYAGYKLSARYEVRSPGGGQVGLSVSALMIDRVQRHSGSYLYLWGTRVTGEHREPWASFPWTDAELGRIYNDRDYASALKIFWYIHDNFVVPRASGYSETQYTKYNWGRCDKWLNLDLTPSLNLFGDVLNAADLYLTTGILPGPWAMGWETAYIEAGKSLPQAATNAAANILEAASLLSSIFSGNILGELPKTARDAWLSYRYVYTTTKLDVRELQSTFRRLGNIAQYDRAQVYGQYTRGDINYRVGYEVDVAQILPRDVSTTLQKFGLELNALNVWDMIPYSFVVDWFLPISDIIEYFQDLSACRLEPLDLWFSLTTVRDGFQIYLRLPGRKLSTMPYLQLSNAGTKTICLRIADAVALFSP